MTGAGKPIIGTVDRVTADPLALMPEVERATDRLLETAGRLRDHDVAAPSLLPGWSRGHVLTHLARNADSLTRLLDGARSGVRTQQYPSREHRDVEIAAGAGRGAAEQVADLRAAAERFASAVDAMPAEAWTFQLDGDPPRPAASVIWRRLREVEVHHVDLDAGYATADWSEAFSHRLLHEVVAALRARPGAPDLVLRSTDLGHELATGDGDGPRTITGPTHALAGWLTGRTGGAGLSATPAGPLPEPPQWM
jgi:maleylpyruvate isomerase